MGGSAISVKSKAIVNTVFPELSTEGVICGDEPHAYALGYVDKPRIARSTTAARTYGFLNSIILHRFTIKEDTVA